MDFSYEVSRALSACEGALLVVDASQGVEAQTVANTFLAAQHNLTIIPVINKVDLPAAQPEEVGTDRKRSGDSRGRRSAHQRQKRPGRRECARSHRRAVPPPVGSADAPLRALIFDSWFDPYRGAVVLVRVMEGRLAPHQKIRLCANEEVYEVESLGALTPKAVVIEELAAGDVGFVIANIKRVADARVGDTVIEPRVPRPPCPASKPSSPWSLPALSRATHDYEMLRDALGKLQLNDAAFFYEPENSVALGFGFRCGFLGLLHMEIVAGAARARIRHRSHHHRAQRALSHHHHPRRSHRSG